MKFLIKKIYITLFLLTILLTSTKIFARDSKIQYAEEDISNYFLGVISVNQSHNKEALRYLKKVQSIKNKHSQFNVEFIRTNVLLGKFKQAFAFSESIWTENELFFETDLLLGLDSFIKKDYIKAEKYFKRLNKISQYNLIFDNFFGNVLKELEVVFRIPLFFREKSFRDQLYTYLESVSYSPVMMQSSKRCHLLPVLWCTDVDRDNCLPQILYEYHLRENNCT